MSETNSERRERRAMVEEQLRESLDYECELAQDVKEELSSGFDEFFPTAEVLMKMQEAKLESIRHGREFDDDEEYDECRAEQWDIYLENNHDDLEERLREPYEEAFQQKVEEAMV